MVLGGAAVGRSAATGVGQERVSPKGETSSGQEQGWHAFPVMLWALPGMLQCVGADRAGSAADMPWVPQLQGRMVRHSRDFTWCTAAPGVDLPSTPHTCHCKTSKQPQRRSRPSLSGKGAWYPLLFWQRAAAGIWPDGSTHANDQNQAASIGGRPPAPPLAPPTWGCGLGERWQRHVLRCS